jgi:uncharacterized protein (TIGR03437 family)
MSCRNAVFLTVWSALTAIAQQTTNINLNFTLTTQTRIERTVAISQRSVTPFGVVAVQTDLTHPRGNGGVILGNDQGSVSFVFNRLDGFDVSVDIPNAPGSGTGPKSFTGNITAGTGAYKGATGTVAFTLGIDNFGTNILSGTGSVTASGKTTSFSLSPPLPLGGAPISGDHNVFTGSGAVTPIGNTTVKTNLDSNSTGGNDGIITLTFNAADSISLYLSYNVDGPPPANTPASVVGGTGAYAGVTGTTTITFTQAGSTFVVTGSGSITQRGATAPTISQVSTAYGRDETAQNTFIVIKGTDLVPDNTPKDGVIWSNAPEFASGKMPTVLQGIGVKVNDRPAFVYFFCSAATNPACASDQINVLTPLDSSAGNVRVTVSNNGVESRPLIVPMRQAEPSFLVFNTQGYVAAVHADGSLIGPTSLYPGLTTPARGGETILAFAVGFGLPTTTLVPGSSTQFGPLPQAQNPPSPQCVIGTTPATVAAATLISPGLYQFNVVVPSSAPRGDNLIYCSYTRPGLSSFTPAGNLITVQ